MAPSQPDETIVMSEVDPENPPPGADAVVPNNISAQKKNLFKLLFMNFTRIETGTPPLQTVLSKLYTPNRFIVTALQVQHDAFIDWPEGMIFLARSYQFTKELVASDTFAYDLMGAAHKTTNKLYRRAYSTAAAARRPLPLPSERMIFCEIKSIHREVASEFSYLAALQFTGKTTGTIIESMKLTQTVPVSVWATAVINSSTDPAAPKPIIYAGPPRSIDSSAGVASTTSTVGRKRKRTQSKCPFGRIQLFGQRVDYRSIEIICRVTRTSSHECIHDCILISFLNG